MVDELQEVELISKQTYRMFIETQVWMAIVASLLKSLTSTLCNYVSKQAAPMNPTLVLIQTILENP